MSSNSSRNDGKPTAAATVPDVEIVYSPAEHSIRIHRWKVREGFQVTRNHIILLYVVPPPTIGVEAAAEAPAPADLKRLKVAHTGVVRKRLYKDGDIVPMG